MDFNWPWPDAFSTLKPNFIEIGWKMNSGQLSDLQFACKDERMTGRQDDRIQTKIYSSTA